MDANIKHYSRCRVCESFNVVTVFKLTATPLEDQFLPHKSNLSEYPLQLDLCGDCGYLYLPYVINPKLSYSRYLYQSSTTVGLQEHYVEYAESIKNMYGLTKADLVVDLGSNDGSMLSAFKDFGVRVLGVEPASAPADAAIRCGIETLNKFFTGEVVEEILDTYGPAQLVTANYMFANIEDIIAFVKNVKSILNKNGLFVVQTGYHPDQMSGMMFDYIYHEHYSYFTVKVLQFVFDKCGLELINVEKVGPKGGSIRVVAQKAGGKYAISDSVKRILQEEDKGGWHSPAVYRDFQLKINQIKSQLRDQLDLYSTKGDIVGFGASHSTTTLLYEFDLGKYLSYIVDDNPLKQNTFSPGKNISVLSSDILYANPPKTLLILAWQHTDSIIRRHGHLTQHGVSIIAPLPEIKIY